MEDYLCRELNVTDISERASIVHNLCEAQVQIFGHKVVQDILWSNEAPWVLVGYDASSSLSSSEKISVAISVRSPDLLRDLLKQLTTYRGRFTHMNPIVAAINYHDKDMLQIALEQVPIMLVKNPNLSVRLLGHRTRRESQ
jgi:hypothetical protein